jgi:hypothetical protein
MAPETRTEGLSGCAAAGETEAARAAGKTGIAPTTCAADGAFEIAAAIAVGVTPADSVRPGASDGAVRERGAKAPKAEGTIWTVAAAPETEDWAAAPAWEAEKVWAKAEVGIEAERMTASNPEGFIAYRDCNLGGEDHPGAWDL